MAKDCNGKDIELNAKVKVVKQGHTTEGMTGTVLGINNDCIFVNYDNDRPPLPACGDHNDYNLEVIAQ